MIYKTNRLIFRALKENDKENYRKAILKVSGSEGEHKSIKDVAAEALYRCKLFKGKV